MNQSEVKFYPQNNLFLFILLRGSGYLGYMDSNQGYNSISGLYVP